MTTVTAHTIDAMSPMLERFGRYAEETTSKSGRDTRPFGVSLKFNEGVVSQDAQGDVINNPRTSRAVLAATRDESLSLTDRRNKSETKNRKSAQLPASRISMHSPTNEEKIADIAAVTAMLQGIIFQTRRVLPCYYCGSLQSFSLYRFHVDFCQARTEALYTRYGLNTLQLVMCAPKQSIPGVNARKEEVDAFIHACYQSVKQSILPCPECGVLSLVHDLLLHKRVCKSKKKEEKK